MWKSAVQHKDNQDLEHKGTPLTREQLLLQHQEKLSQRGPVHPVWGQTSPGTSHSMAKKLSELELQHQDLQKERSQWQVL
jgi:hypothetical protein